MRVRDVMTHDVCIVRPDHTVEEAARMMAAIDVGLLPVGEQDRLVGMITDRDIAVRAVGEGKGPATQVEAGVREVGKRLSRHRPKPRRRPGTTTR